MMESGPHELHRHGSIAGSAETQETLDIHAHSARGSSPGRPSRRSASGGRCPHTGERSGDSSSTPSHLPSPFSLFSPLLSSQWVLRSCAVSGRRPAPLPALISLPSPEVGPSPAGDKGEALLRKLEKVCRICVHWGWFTQHNFHFS